MERKRQPEFSRTEMLIGHEGMEILARSTIVVFGVGGVGSHAVEALARSGVGCLILADNDQVALSNINRQSIACHSTVGRYKTEVMKEKIADINPLCRVIAINQFILPDNLDSFFRQVFREVSSVDYMIDAIDTVSAKLAIAEYGWKHSIPLISSMGTGNKLRPELFEITDIYKTSVCPLCKVMRRELKKREIPCLDVLYSKEEPRKPLKAADTEEETASQTVRRSTPGSIAFVPPAAGLMIAGKVIRTLCGL
ncbi:MAG: tRNA threonylcarbamoyladenosine dehydratase [Lachnospiraceae bacterium]|nr:tRNA threonylcarbamoyladenosine dehydratase [Lachnospiraceae bacterium]